METLPPKASLVRLPGEHLKRLREFAKQSRRSITAELQIAVEEYAEKNGNPIEVAK